MYSNVVLLILSVVSVVVVILLSSFAIKRRNRFNKYITGTNIPFLPIQSYLKGSLDLMVKADCAFHSKVDEYFQRLNCDTFAAFYGPWPIVFTKDLDLLKKVFITDSQKHINRHQMANISPVFTLSLLQLLDDDWRRVRKAVVSTMTPIKLRAYNFTQTIDHCLDRMMESVRDKLEIGNNHDNKSVIIDSCKLSKDLLMDISLDSGLNQPNQIDYNLDENKIVRYTENMMEESASKPIIFAWCFPAFAIVLKFILLYVKNLEFLDYMTKNATKIIDKAHWDITEKKQELESKKYIHSLIKLHEQKKITKDELLANVVVLLEASFDTTSQSLIALMWHLAKNKEAQEKLRQEIIKYGVESEFLEWSIKEAIRLNPPVNTNRTIGEDFYWKGSKFMKGMDIFVAPYLIHRDKAIWGQDASEYKPERFENSDRFHSAQYFSFGLGPRNCVGYLQAMLILKHATSRIVLEFQLEFCNDTPQELEYKAPTEEIIFMASIRGPTPLRLVPLK